VLLDAGDIPAGHDGLQVLRCRVGAQLATYRTAAGISQPQLGRALGRTRSLISKVEHGARAMPAELWTIADTVCGADGALISEHHALVEAEQDHRVRWRAHRRLTHQRAPHTEATSDRARSAPPPAARQPDQDVAWPQMTQADGQLAKELRHVVAKLVQSMGRRDAMRLVGSVLAAAGLSWLNPDDYTRIAQAVVCPHRLDAHVVNNLAVTLAHCKRQEDTLGPCQVLDTVVAQHELVRRLREGGCPTQLQAPLSLVDSNMASTIGGYLIDMGDPDTASRYFARARRTAHEARNTSAAAYAAINASFAARLRGDTPTALDTAAAARSLAARTNDPRLQSLAEQMAAGAYALDGQHGPCMAATARAHDLLTTAHDKGVPDSPAYWVHHGGIDSQRSTYLALLDRPQEAVEAATTAQAQYDRTYVGRYTLCEIRLGHALVLAEDITEAARVLGDAANQAHLFPRLTADLAAARALMQPWATTHAVQTLDAQLHACGLLPATTPQLKTRTMTVT
jgi:transcriptional regulator with XRE-family HTH domain